MTVKAIFTCDVCGKEEILAGISTKNRGNWRAVHKKDFYGWDDSMGGFNAFEHEWTCSKQCRERWVDLDPENRVLLEYEKEQEWSWHDNSFWVDNKKVSKKPDPLIEQIPVHIVRKGKKIIKVSLGHTIFNIADGKIIKGEDHYIQIRKSDLNRFQNKV